MSYRGSLGRVGRKQLRLERGNLSLHRRQRRVGRGRRGRRLRLWLLLLRHHSAVRIRAEGRRHLGHHLGHLGHLGHGWRGVWPPVRVKR